MSNVFGDAKQYQTGAGALLDSRQVLDKIDGLLEGVVGKGAEGAQAELLALAQSDTSGEETEISNVLRAARTRALLAMRDIELSEASLSVVQALASSDPDALTRGACIAVLAAKEKYAAVDDWLKSEKDPRAIMGVLVDWSRSATKLVDGPEEASAFVDFPVHPGLGQRITSLMEDGSKSDELRVVAARAVKAYSGEPGVLEALERLVLADSVLEVRRAGVLAIANQPEDPKAVALVTRLAFDQAVPAEVRHAAIVACRSITTSEVTDGLAREVLSPTSSQRAVAATALIGREPAPSDETWAALVLQYQRETDPAVKTLLGKALRMKKSD